MTTDTTKPVKHFRPQSPISAEVKAKGVELAVKAMTRIYGYYLAEQSRSAFELIPFAATDAIAREFNRKADLLDARGGKLVYTYRHLYCSREKALDNDGNAPDYVIDNRLEVLASVEAIIKLLDDADVVIKVYTPDNVFTVENGE
jgi:hypothetical protein